MEQAIDHDALDALLRRCGSSWDAAQTHGLLSGRLSIAGPDSGFAWLAQVLEGAEEDGPGRNECEAMLSALFETTYRQLSERLSEFEPLLPDDDDSTGSAFRERRLLVRGIRPLIERIGQVRKRIAEVGQ